MFSLNLLPTSVKEEAVAAIHLRRWLVGLIVMTVFTSSGAGGVALVVIMLQRHATVVAGDLATQQQIQTSKSTSNITQITGSLNTTITSLTNILGEPRSWGRDTAVVLSLLPKGATVTSLTIQAGGRFHLVGTADTRQTYVLLDQTVKGSSLLRQVTSPTAASKRVSVPFDFSGFVQPVTAKS